MANSVAVPVAEETASCTRPAPTTSTASGSGSLPNAANWPGISSVVPPRAELTADSPGTVVSAAGLPPAGVTTGCGPPSSVTGSLSTAGVSWPGRPG